MTTLHRFALAAALLSAQPIAAQTATPSTFRPLEFLVGHCWIGTFPDGKQTDEHCFEWMYDRKFIRDRHVVRDGAKPTYEGESTYAWDAKAKRITFAYYNVAGDVTTGHVEETPEGIVFPQKHKTAAGATVELKTVWTRPSTDAYHVWVGQKSGTEWKVLWTMDLKRREGPAR